MKAKLITITLMLLLIKGIFSQMNNQYLFCDDITGNTPPFITEQQDNQFVFVTSFTKRPGHYSRIDWQKAIDSVWGPGLPTATKLGIFDELWRQIDSAFACFHNNPVNWDSLKQVYRPQIAAGVSRGRFSAILSHILLPLKEGHTRAYDLGVANTPLTAGIPIFNMNGNGDNGFGAGLTPLQDSSLLVYNVLPSHPLGIQRGDRILGYDRIPWKVLYKQLLDWQLPIRFESPIGSSPSAISHQFLRCAGRNWHLFDTIDIVKYSSGDTVHLPTSLMTGQTLSLYNSEQMDIPGVTKPNYPSQVCSYGIVTNTNIGYIYVWAWGGNAQQEFLDAVQALMQTDGLIIDFRFNMGGNMYLSNQGLRLLFDTSVTTIDVAKRCIPNNHQMMCPVNMPDVIPGAPPGYNKPIAVLTGPGAVSSGDQVALRLKYHTRSRFFGKSTSATFNTPVAINLHYDFYFRYAFADAYRLCNPNIYLTHVEFPVDEEVWLTPDKVAQGRDDVVEAAINWINSTIGISQIGTELPQRFNLSQNYPNPFNPVTKITFALTKSGDVKITVYDVLGREIAVLVNKKLSPGNYEVDFDGTNYPSGVYLYKLTSGDFADTKKMILIK